MVYVVSNVILDSNSLVWFKGNWAMREEDKKAIHRALAILKVECQEHKSCKSCRFYDCTYNDCLLNKPPMHYKVDEIIKCFT